MKVTSIQWSETIKLSGYAMYEQTIGHTPLGELVINRMNDDTYKVYGLVKTLSYDADKDISDIKDECQKEFESIIMDSVEL